MDKKCLVAVMGPTGSGKSSLIKGITGRQDIKVGHTLLSETDCVQCYDTTINSTAITLIDTPGFDDSSVSDLEILRALSRWLKEHCEEGQLLTGIIYLHPITKTRIEGSALRALTILKKLCGNENLKNVILVTTFWNEVTNEVGAKRERELMSTDDFWKQMIDKGSRVERLSRDYDMFKAVLVEIAGRPTMKLGIQKEMQEGKSLEETLAGLFINAEAHKLEQAHQAEMEDLGDWWKKHLAEETKKTEREALKRKKKAEDAIAAIMKREADDAQRLKQLEQLQDHKRRMKVKELENQLAEAAKKEAEKKQKMEEEEEELARKRREENRRARYKDSELQRVAVDNDIDLLRAANAAGLCRISVHGINPEGIGMNTAGDWTVDRSGINSWCDKCRNTVGNRWMVVCKLCPEGKGSYNLCSNCYNEDGAGCLNEDHQLFKSDQFMNSTCSRATSESLGVRCDRQDCRKTMKGLYFHCCRCDADDFDICLQCVMRGRGCRDNSHWLEWAIAPIDIPFRAR